MRKAFEELIEVIHEDFLMVFEGGYLIIVLDHILIGLSVGRDVSTSDELLAVEDRETLNLPDDVVLIHGPVSEIICTAMALDCE